MGSNKIKKVAYSTTFRHENEYIQTVYRIIKERKNFEKNTVFHSYKYIYYPTIETFLVKKKQYKFIFFRIVSFFVTKNKLETVRSSIIDYFKITYTQKILHNFTKNKVKN